MPAGSQFDRGRADELRILVDGVVFGEGPRAAGVRWERLLRRLAEDPSLRINLLDRGGSPAIDRIDSIDFPSYRDMYTPADSQLIQRMADHHGSATFISTAWTTPTTTPSVAVVFGDALPPAAELSDRRLGECALAIRHATRVVCADEPARIALQEQLALTRAQATEVDTAADGDDVARLVDSALRTAAATGSAAAEFYRRWSILRDMQARVDG